MKKGKTVLSARKVMVSVFRNSDKIMFIDYLQRGTTILLRDCGEHIHTVKYVYVRTVSLVQVSKQFLKTQEKTVENFEKIIGSQMRE